MATTHISPAANALLVYLLDGQARTDVGPPEQLAEIETLLRVKLIALVADGEEMRLTPAGRRWATIKRDYPNVTRDERRFTFDAGDTYLPGED